MTSRYTALSVKSSQPSRRKTEQTFRVWRLFLHGQDNYLPSSGLGRIEHQHRRQRKPLRDEGEGEATHPLFVRSCIARGKTEDEKIGSRLLVFNLVVNAQFVYTQCIPQTKATGEILLDEVFKHLGLEETDYFGLQFIDRKQNVVSYQG